MLTHDISGRFVEQNPLHHLPDILEHLSRKERPPTQVAKVQAQPGMVSLPAASVLTLALQVAEYYFDHLMAVK